MNWLALDIGGANLKRADGIGFAESTPFALWKHHRHLAQELRKLIAESPACDRLVVTMTGELADCFESKSEGVQFILSQVVEAADGRHSRVYLSDGRIVTPTIAERKPLLAAAANWHALACFAGRFAKSGTALLIDVGSTTCDIIPLLDGAPFGVSAYDTERLMASELVYTGVERSPVCAVVESVTYRGSPCPVAYELFATTYDAYLILGELREDPTKTNTADGRPATKHSARIRLGRAICADEQNFNHRDAVVIAQEIYTAQHEKLGTALSHVLGTLPSDPDTVVISGQGEFMAKRVLNEAKLSADIVSLGKQLGPDVSKCATAHALATLAREATS